MACKNATFTAGQALHIYALTNRMLLKLRHLLTQIVSPQPKFFCDWVWSALVMEWNGTRPSILWLATLQKVKFFKNIVSLKIVLYVYIETYYYTDRQYIVLYLANNSYYFNLVYVRICIQHSNEFIESSKTRKYQAYKSMTITLLNLLLQTYCLINCGMFQALLGKMIAHNKKENQCLFFISSL